MTCKKCEEYQEGIKKLGDMVLKWIDQSGRLARDKLELKRQIEELKNNKQQNEGKNERR